MLTEANYRANIATASRNVRASLGLAENSADWTHGQRIAFLGALAAIVVAHPQSFDEQRVATAQFILGHPVDALLEDGGALSQFIDAAIAEERALNPFDSTNRADTVKVAIGIALALGTVYIIASTAPKWVPVVAGAFGRKAAA